MSFFFGAIAHDVVVRGRQCRRFPLVVGSDGHVLMDVMRYLIRCFGNGGAEAALTTYASHLRDFHEQLAISDCVIGDVSTDFLNRYRDAIEGRASRPYAAQVLRTVLAYLDYLEKRGAIRGVVGESSNYRVVIGRAKNGGVSHALSEGGASPKSNYYPSDRSIEAIKAFGPLHPAKRERFELMVEWGHVKGLRAKEICGLRQMQLPDEDSILRALEEDRCLELRLVETKGGKLRNVDVHPLLLARTRKWIETERPLIVHEAKLRARAGGRAIEVSDHIFVSEATGRGMTPKSLSNAVRAAFKRAVKAEVLTEAERVWLHGLRKRMVNREMNDRLTRGSHWREEQIRQETGHGTRDSLGRYVADPA